jgi:hypothetical protein
MTLPDPEPNPRNINRHRTVFLLSLPDKQPIFPGAARSIPPPRLITQEWNNRGGLRFHFGLDG